MAHKVRWCRKSCSTIGETMLFEYRSPTTVAAGQLSMQNLLLAGSGHAREVYLGQIDWATVDKEELSVSSTTSPSSRLGHIPAFPRAADI